MNFIDTHCHLYLEEFNLDLDAVVARAKKAGISRFLLPNIDSHSIEPMLKVMESHAECVFPMIGLHPTSVKNDYEKELSIVESWLEKAQFIAIGEIGIDLYWDKTFLKEQQLALDYQFQLALKYNLPVAIHSRDSFNEIMDVLKPYQGRGLKGVFHCFTGDYQQAKAILDFGFYLGIGGVVTFKNTQLREVLSQIPLDNIVLETDAPYLAPVPYRGKRNESSYIPIIAEKLAEVYQIEVEKIANQTTLNATKLFNFRT
ncbi:MAG: TatD family hydrolase [Bacteroidales bacterium]|nr:TatD family hydrolase [Bacteroidales bacterium]